MNNESIITCLNCMIMIAVKKRKSTTNLIANIEFKEKLTSYTLGSSNSG